MLYNTVKLGILQTGSVQVPLPGHWGNVPARPLDYFHCCISQHAPGYTCRSRSTLGGKQQVRSSLMVAFLKYMLEPEVQKGLKEENMEPLPAEVMNYVKTRILPLLMVDPKAPQWFYEGDHTIYDGSKPYVYSAPDINSDYNLLQMTRMKEGLGNVERWIRNIEARDLPSSLNATIIQFNSDLEHVRKTLDDRVKEYQALSIAGIAFGIAGSCHRDVNARMDESCKAHRQRRTLTAADCLCHISHVASSCEQLGCGTVHASAQQCIPLSTCSRICTTMHSHFDPLRSLYLTAHFAPCMQAIFTVFRSIAKDMEGGSGGLMSTGMLGSIPGISTGGDLRRKPSALEDGLMPLNSGRAQSGSGHHSACRCGNGTHTPGLFAEHTASLLYIRYP
eukprot:scaffold258040_cov18-Tisochrysis_lutea.AAC.1